MKTLYTSDSEEQNIDTIDESTDINFPPPDTQTKSPPDTAIRYKSHLDMSNRLLFRTKSIFPFDLFPDEVIIDTYKVDIVSNFFYSKDTYSIPIQNISGVNSSFDLFFGQLRIEAWGLNKVPKPITYLSKQDAIKARRIISGLIMANKNEIDLKHVSIYEARAKLEEIGKSRS